jgi:hypothetical protein
MQGLPVPQGFRRRSNGYLFFCVEVNNPRKKVIRKSRRYCSGREEDQTTSYFDMPHILDGSKRALFLFFERRAI